MTKEFQGIEDDPFLHCGHENLLIGMIMFMTISWVVAIVAVVRLGDVKKENVELVRIVEKLTLLEK